MLDPGRRRRCRRRRDPTREACRRDGAGDGVERRSARSRSADLGLDHGIDYSQDGWVDEVRGLTGGARRQPRRRLGRRARAAGSVACLAYRGRCITVGSAGPRRATDRRPCARQREPVDYRRVPRRRDRDAACAADDPASLSTTSPPVASRSSSTAPSRSPRPRPPTRTSRAARPWDGSVTACP